MTRSTTFRKQTQTLSCCRFVPSASSLCCAESVTLCLCDSVTLCLCVSVSLRLCVSVCLCLTSLCAVGQARYPAGQPAGQRILQQHQLPELVQPSLSRPIWRAVAEVQLDDGLGDARQVCLPDRWHGAGQGERSRLHTALLVCPFTPTALCFSIRTFWSRTTRRRTPAGSPTLGG